MRRHTRLMILFILALLMGALPQLARAQAVTKEIDVLGFKFKVEDGAIVVENDKLVLKGKGSLDLSSALGSGAVISVDEMSIDNDTTFKMKGVNMPEINLGPFKAKIVPDDIVLEKIISQGIQPYINLKVILEVALGSDVIQTVAVIPITKEGIKDATVTLAPPAGKDNVLSKDLGGIVLTLNSGQVEIKNKQFGSFVFKGSVDLFGTKVSLSQVSITPEKISATARLEGSIPMALGSIGLALRGDVTLDYGSSGLALNISEAAIDLTKIIPGATGEILLTDVDLAKASIAAEGTLTQKIEIYGVGLTINHFKFTSDKTGEGATATRATKIVLDGSVEIAAIGQTVNFTGFEINSDGTAKAEFALSPEQQLTMYGVGVTISGMSFEVKQDSFSVFLAGMLNLGNDALPFKTLGIAGGKVNGEFDVTDSAPFSFSWFQYLKVTHLAIEDNALVFSGKIDIPDPFKYTFAFDDLKFDPQGAWEAAKSVTSADAKAAAAKAWEKVTDPSLVTLVNTYDQPLSVAGFQFWIDAITIPNPLKIAKTKQVPDTLLRLYMRSEIALMDKKLNVNVDGLEVTKAGVKDLTLNINAPDGAASLLDMGFGSWAHLTISSAVLIIKDAKLNSLGFTGSATLFDRTFTIVKLGYEDNLLSGTMRPVGDPAINIAGVFLRFQGDIVFKFGGGGKGGGDPGAASQSTFEVSIKNLAVDFSGILGSQMQLIANELSINNGSIYAELSMSSAVDIYGVTFQITKAILESKAPESASGKRTFSANLTGIFTIPTPKLELTFTNFKVSSTGEFGGDLSLSALQEFSLFGVTFRISNIRIEKLVNQPLSIALKGSITFMAGSTLEFTELKVQGGKLSATFNISESNPLKIPYCDFIGVTKLQIVDNSLKISGFLQIPAPLGVRFDLNDLVISSSGTVSGGSLALHEAITISLDQFSLVINSASFDIVSKYVSFSGEIKLPSSVVPEPIKFSNIGISLASSGSGQMNTANTSSVTNSLTDNKHGLSVSITGINFGSIDGKFFVNISGSLGLNVGTSGFTLYVTNLRITQKLEFSVGMITGGIKIAGFGVEVSQFAMDDSGSDPSITISGGLSLPKFGGIAVRGLKIYKSGKIELSGVRVTVDYNAYKIDIEISYIDKVLTCEGTVLVANKGLHAKGVFGPDYFSIDLDVYGLTIPLFPGIFLDSIGGGVTYQKSPEYLEFRIRCGIAFGDKNLLHGTVQVLVNTTGIIEITGELKAFASLFTVGEVKITLDLPKATLTGTAHVNYPVYGVILWVDAHFNIYASPSDFYLTANCDAKIFNIWTVGNAYLYIGTQGFKFNCSLGLNLGFVSAGFEFKFEINRQLTIYAYFHGWLSFDIWIASVSGDIKAELLVVPTNIDSSYFKGSVRLEVCVLGVCGGCNVYLRIDRNGVHAGKNED